MTSKCSTPHCKGRNDSGGKCWKCIKRKYAEKYPVRYAYQVLKNNARRRGHEFTLTLQEFTRFCVKTKILLGRGRLKDCYSIDRIDERRGYHADNIQKIMVGENAAKYHKQIKYDYEHKIGMTVKYKIEEIECSPF